MSARRIVRIRVARMWESCQRATFYVELTTDEGFSTTPASYATGSVYTEFKGLSEEEARERALMDAHDWADFLGLTVDPFSVDGKPVEPSMKLDRYTTRRLLAARADGASMRPPVIEGESSRDSLEPLPSLTKGGE